MMRRRKNFFVFALFIAIVFVFGARNIFAVDSILLPSCDATKQCCPCDEQGVFACGSTKDKYRKCVADSQFKTIAQPLCYKDLPCIGAICQELGINCESAGIPCFNNTVESEKGEDGAYYLNVCRENYQLVRAQCTLTLEQEKNAACMDPAKQVVCGGTPGSANKECAKLDSGIIIFCAGRPRVT